MKPLLEVRGLGVRFETTDGVVRAVDGVSFSLAPGEALGIVGESGSGKSVCALTLLGLTRAGNARIEGQVLLEGRDMLGLDEAELRALRGAEVAMIFQDPLSALHPLKRVGVQVAEAVQAHRELSRAGARARVVELLEQVGLPRARALAGAYPHELSGGMRQRVMIAMALANEPKLLIADEPTTALDVTVQAQILELLGRLRRELGMALVMITHDLGVIAEAAERVAVMYAGRIVEEAATGDLFEHPQHPYTWGLLRSLPRLDAPPEAELVPIQGAPPSLIAPPAGCRFHPRCPHVRERHRREEPALEPVAGEPGHAVACLLGEAERRRLWDELRDGSA